MSEQPDFITPADDDEEIDHPFGTPDEDGWITIKRGGEAGDPDRVDGKRKRKNASKRMARAPKPRATRRRR